MNRTTDYLSRNHGGITSKHGGIQWCKEHNHDASTYAGGYRAHEQSHCGTGIDQMVVGAAIAAQTLQSVLA